MFRCALLAVLLSIPVSAQQPFELEIEGDKLSLSITDTGMAMTDFVKLAQSVTGRVFVFSKKEIEGAAPIKLVGTVRMKKGEFLSFFKTRLYVEGFAMSARADGDSEILEITSIRSQKPEKGSDARYVIEAKLVDHKSGKEEILTAIALKHVTAKYAVERLTAVQVALETDVKLGRASKSLLIQGAGEGVYCAWRMLRLIDVPPVAVIEVVALKHAVASELVAGMKLLLAGRNPAVVVVAHKKVNGLMISGPRALVGDVIEIVGLLDQAAKR